MKKRVSRAPALATGSDGTAALAQTEATGALAPANATPPAADAQRQAPAPCTAGVASKALYGESAGGHEEIVGTATPREEQLQHVPVAVAATSGRMSGGSGVVALRSLTQVVPGFVGRHNVGVTQPVIGGVRSCDISVGDGVDIAADLAGVYPKNDGYIDDLIRGGYLGQPRVVDVHSTLPFPPSDAATIVPMGEDAGSNRRADANQPFNAHAVRKNNPGHIPVPVRGRSRPPSGRSSIMSDSSVHRARRGDLARCFGAQDSRSWWAGHDRNLRLGHRRAGVA